MGKSGKRYEGYESDRIDFYIKPLDIWNYGAIMNISNKGRQLCSIKLLYIWNITALFSFK
jgi:hypothetical protein